MKPSLFKTIIGASLFSVVGFIILPTISAVVLGVGATIAMTDAALAWPVKAVPGGIYPRPKPRPSSKIKNKGGNSGTPALKARGIKGCSNCKGGVH
jgi:hypothetical protein